MKITQRLAENEQLSFNVFFGTNREGTNKGYRVSVSKGFIDNGLVKTIPLASGNFTAFIKEGKRKSDKQIEIIGDFISDNIDLLVYMWNEGDYAEMVEMIKGGTK